jgi:hypothetical protein
VLINNFDYESHFFCKNNEGDNNVSKEVSHIHRAYNNLNAHNLAFFNFFDFDASVSTDVIWQ